MHRNSREWLQVPQVEPKLVDISLFIALTCHRHYSHGENSRSLLLSSLIYKIACLHQIYLYFPRLQMYYVCLPSIASGRVACLQSGFRMFFWFVINTILEEQKTQILTDRNKCCLLIFSCNVWAKIYQLIVQWKPPNQITYSKDMLPVRVKGFMILTRLHSSSLRQTQHNH